MQENPIIGKHSIILTPDVLDLIHECLSTYIESTQDKLDQLAKDLEREKEDLIVGDPREGWLTNTREELKRVQAVCSLIEETKGEVQRRYNWNYKQLAKMFRRVRITLKLEHIQDMYSTKVMLICLMEMLKDENRLFSRDKFLQVINAER